MEGRVGRRKLGGRGKVRWREEGVREKSGVEGE